MWVVYQDGDNWMRYRVKNMSALNQKKKGNDLRL